MLGKNKGGRGPGPGREKEEKQSRIRGEEEKGTEERWLEHGLETDHGDGDKEEVKEMRLVDLLKEDVEIAVGGGNRRQ